MFSLIIEKFNFEKLTKKKSSIKFRIRPPIHKFIIWLIQLHLCFSISVGGSKKFESDIGIYYLGGMSLNSDFNLYRDFFDHKGPMYYFWIFIFRNIVPYNSVGVGLIIVLTVLFWFLAIELVIYWYKIGDFESNLIRILSSLSLFLQNSNSVISIFANTFTVLSLIFLLKFLESNKLFLLILSTFFISFALLTRVDYILFVIISIIIILFVNKKSYVVLIYFLSAMFIFCLILILLHKILFFSLEDYWLANWKFNFEFYLPNKYHSFEILGIIKIKTELAIYLGLSGFLSLLLIVLFTKNFKLIFYFSVLILVPLIVLLLSGSDKNYHLMILSPGSIVFMLITIIKDKNLNIKKIIYTLNYLLLILCLYYFLDNYKCFLPNKCEEQEMLPLRVTSTSEFYLNNGWIYINSGLENNINITSHFLMVYDIPNLSENFIQDFEFDKSKLKIIRNKSLQEAFKNQSEFFLFLQGNLKNSEFLRMLEDKKSDYQLIHPNDWITH